MRGCFTIIFCLFFGCAYSMKSGATSLGEALSGLCNLNDKIEAEQRSVVIALVADRLLDFCREHCKLTGGKHDRRIFCEKYGLVFQTFYQIIDKTFEEISMRHAVVELLYSFLLAKLGKQYDCSYLDPAVLCEYYLEMAKVEDVKLPRLSTAGLMRQEDISLYDREGMPRAQRGKKWGE